MQVAPYEGLEVVSTQAPDGPEIVSVQAAGGLEVVSAQKPESVVDMKDDIGSAAGNPETLPPISNRICGLPRTVFWAMVGMAGMAAIAIALGAGLGVALNKAQNANAHSGSNAGPESVVTSSSSPAPSTSTSTANSTGTPTTGTPTTGTPTASSTSIPMSSPSPLNICPGINGTLAIPQVIGIAGSIEYLVLCDNGYGTVNNIQNLLTNVVNTWDKCLAQCNILNIDENSDDIGATWTTFGDNAEPLGSCTCTRDTLRGVYKYHSHVTAQPLPRYPENIS